MEIPKTSNSKVLFFGFFSKIAAAKTAVKPRPWIASFHPKYVEIFHINQVNGRLIRTYGRYLLATELMLALSPSFSINNKTLIPTTKGKSHTGGTQVIEFISGA